ncbi:MAG: site-specific integrase [Oscillospiraceae bacterium]|jgi:integrase|nr:site-specific integrase [Oscillospiraceae bacterium]
MASYRPRKNKAGEIISYEIRVSRGYDPISKKALKPYTMTWTRPDGWSDNKAKKELERVAGAFQAACDRGEVLTKEQEKALIIEQTEQAKREQAEQERKPTFARYAEIFIKEKSATFAPGTLANYKDTLKKVLPVFGEMRMEDITHLTVKQYITDLQANGKNEFTGEPLAHKTVLKHYIILHALFENAVENEVIPFSPMQNMKRPKPRKGETPKEAVVYSEEEVQYIMECLDKEPLKWKALVMFAIDSGCRRGEIVGLKWSDIDFKTGKTNIHCNAQYTPGKGVYISTPKSHKSRVIYLNAPVLSVLAEWRTEQTRLIFGQGIFPTGYCFTQDNGQMMHPQAPTSYLSRFGKKYNLPGIHPHALRHTMATISIANGADIVSVSEKLGHADPAITLNVYSHANEEAQQRANAVLADALYKNSKRA